MAALARENPLHVRFIEMMPIGLGKEFAARGEELIKSVLEKEYGINDTNGRKAWKWSLSLLYPGEVYRQDRIYQCPVPQIL